MKGFRTARIFRERTAAPARRPEVKPAVREQVGSCRNDIKVSGYSLQAGNGTGLQLPGDFHPLEYLDLVTGLDAVILYPDTAFGAGPDFIHVILEAAQ